MYYADIMTQQNSTPLGNGNCSISKHNVNILMTWWCLCVHVCIAIPWCCLYNHILVKSTIYMFRVCRGSIQSSFFKSKS